jgi:hypothetical protein
MTEQRVRELAEELARRLEDPSALDDESREALDALRRQVDGALAGEVGQRAPSAHARGLVERFESEHPELTALIQRLAEALSNAGI